MNHKVLKSLRSPIWVVIVLALACLAVNATSVFANNQAPDCEGMDLEYCLRFGRDSGQAQLIPVSGGFASSQAVACESMDLEYCLRYGSQYAQTHQIPGRMVVLARSIEKEDMIPVTGFVQDFGVNYWLVVGPAGGEPVQITP